MGLLRGFMKKLLTPAEKPARRSADAYQDALQRQQELVKKVRQAQANLVTAKKQLEASIAEGRKKLSQLEAQGLQDPFSLQLHRVACEELQGLEQEARELGEQEQSLAVVEQRLSAQIEAISAQQEVLAARSSAAQARDSVVQALGDAPQELDTLGVAVRQVELRTERVQARASAIEHLVERNILKKPGFSIGDPNAQRLAEGYVTEASKESTSLKQQLNLGLMTLLDVVYEYEQLKALLNRQKETEPLSVAYIPSLVDEAYQQAMTVLEGALELMRALRSVDRSRMEAEIAELQKEIELLRGDETQAARVKIKEETIALESERLQMVKRQEIRVEELLHQARRCGAALNSTRIELTALKAESAETGVQAVTDTLRRTISQAKEVQEEMKRMGF